jgi:hypothetical protein
MMSSIGGQSDCFETGLLPGRGRQPYSNLFNFADVLDEQIRQGVEP